MKRRFKILAAGFAAAALVAGCSSSQPPAHHASASTPAATAPAVSPSPGAANDRAFAYAQASPVVRLPELRSLVAGAVMDAYIYFEAASTQATAESGTSATVTVSPVAGGYNLTASDGSSFTYTAFQHDAAGRITGVSVNGQPVASRLATAPDATGPGMALRHVVAYRLTGGPDLVGVAFTATNTGIPSWSSGPPFLAQYSTATGQYAEDDSQSQYPDSLPRGASTSVVEVFDTGAITGTLRLIPNDQASNVLVSATLGKVSP